MHNYKLLFTVYFVACLSNINKYSLCIAALALKNADDSNVSNYPQYIFPYCCPFRAPTQVVIVSIMIHHLQLYPPSLFYTSHLPLLLLFTPLTKCNHEYSFILMRFAADRLKAVFMFCQDSDEK